MKYEEAMSYIRELGKFESNYGLNRTKRILELLGNPQNDYKIIHVAGTNGKGSTTSMITSLLMGKNYKVGMYTSPYLEEFEERIQINRVNIPKEELANCMDKIVTVVNKVIEEGYEHPTEFEIITCLMFYYFSKCEVQYAVVEVGLGGRLDSTNVITPLVSVIASISYDHTNILGNTLREIASEKAGIIKQNIPVVTYNQKEEAMKVLEEVSKEKNAELSVIDVNDGKLINIVNDNEFYQKVQVKVFNNTYNIDLPLLGEHQINNLMLALGAFLKVCELEKLKVDNEEINYSIRKVKWIGRLEVLNKKPLVVIDGAHNIQGITALKENIFKYFKFNNMYLLLGILADKQVHDMVDMIAPNAKKVYALTPHSDRAEKNTQLKDEILKVNSNCEALDSYEEAYKKALLEANDDDIIVISGSLYMIGDMRKIITRNM